MPRFTIVLLFLCSWFSVAGCSKFVSVEGIVTLDGKPVSGASVVFHPEDERPGERHGPHQANGGTDENGRFSLRTINKSGAWPGSYKVTVSKREMPADLKKQMAPNPSPDPSPTPNAQKQANSLPQMPNPLAGGRPINPGDLMKETLPEIYTSLKSTPLTMEISAGGTKEANLELKSKP